MNLKPHPGTRQLNGSGGGSMAKGKDGGRPDSPGPSSSPMGSMGGSGSGRGAGAVAKGDPRDPNTCRGVEPGPSPPRPRLSLPVAPVDGRPCAGRFFFPPRGPPADCSTWSPPAVHPSAPTPLSPSPAPSSPSLTGDPCGVRRLPDPRPVDCLVAYALTTWSARTAGCRPRSTPPTPPPPLGESTGVLLGADGGSTGGPLLAMAAVNGSPNRDTGRGAACQPLPLPLPPPPPPPPSAFRGGRESLARYFPVATAVHTRPRLECLLPRWRCTRVARALE